MSVDEISKPELFTDFSPGTDELIEEFAREHMLEEEPLPVGYPYGELPMGNNTNPLVINFYERLRYKEADYFTAGEKWEIGYWEGKTKGIRPIDTLYDKNFYGRVDRFQNAIVPKKADDLYVQIASSNVFVFDFVAEGYELLKRNLKIAGDINAIDRDNSVYSQIEAKAGWYNYENGYRRVIDLLFQNFNGYLHAIDKRKFNTIVTFKDYAAALIDFMGSGIYPAPITLTGVVLSSPMTPLVSGLAIEIAKESYADDLMKYQSYLTDPNFRYFVKAARKYGFWVDRNGPWRIFADVYSIPMVTKWYARVMGVAYDPAVTDPGNKGAMLGGFFDTYYDRTYTLDVSLLMSHLMRKWNEFAEANPRIVESIPGTVRCPTPSFRTVAVRQKADPDQTTALGLAFWLSFYYDCRSRETGVIYGNKAKLLQRALEMANAYGPLQGVITVHNLFKPYLYDERIFRKYLTEENASVTIGSVKDLLVSRST